MAALQPIMNRLLLLEDRQQVPDGAGGYAETWVPLGSHWAEVTAGTGNEAELDGLAVTSVPYRITVRAVPPGRPSRPRAEQRFRDGQRVFRILAVSERDAGARFLLCRAREEEVSA